MLVCGSWVGVDDGEGRRASVDWELDEGSVPVPVAVPVPVVAAAPVPDAPAASEVLPGETVVAVPLALAAVVIEPVADADPDAEAEADPDAEADPVADPEADLLLVAVLLAEDEEEDLTGSQVRSKRDLVETVVPTIPNCGWLSTAVLASTRVYQ